MFRSLGAMAAMRAVPAVTAGLRDLKNFMLGCLFSLSSRL
jgi:hypothetical protein